MIYKYTLAPHTRVKNLVGWGESFVLSLGLKSLSEEPGEGGHLSLGTIILEWRVAFVSRNND